MGKKKSVVLMVLLTIVIVVLCAITVFPSFAIPKSVKKWNPAVMQYDLGTDLGGGYYTYYYPKGVISETEFENNSAVLEGEEKEKYENSYVKHGGLYLSVDEDDNIVKADGVTVTEEFSGAFAKATKEISARFAKKGYADFRVAVVDDYALRIELPASETSKNQSAAENASRAFTLFALTGELTFEKSGAIVDELKENGIQDLVKSISVDTQYEVAYLEIKFTSLGKEMVKTFKSNASSSSDSSNSTATTLDVKVGDQTLLQISSDYIDDENVVKYPIANESELRYVETLNILLNSALKNGAYDIEFRDISSDIRTFEPVYGDKVLTLLYIALTVVIAGVIAYAIVRMGRYGIVNLYVTLSYLIITALCFAFISEGVFTVTLGTVLVFLMGLVLVNVLHAHVYQAIKAEFNLGKTVESSVKAGYKKTLFGMVDIYAVLLLGGLAFLIGAAGLHTVATQAIICIVTGAFCNLLWARAINFVFLSASKNKYKYFRFVREDDDDE